MRTLEELPFVAVSVQVAQLTRLVDDLLDVSRLGQDKLVINRVAVDLNSVVYQAVETSTPLFQAAGIEFALALPSSPTYVEADASRLAQVFGNMLNNAAKFTPRGGAVTLAPELDEGQAVVRIRDTGIGIEPARLSSVFDLFMQAGSSSRRQDGLGIGLMLAKSLVERHGGHIDVESAGVGRGAVFSIALPVRREAPSSVSPAFGGRLEEVMTAPRRVLVVDDNADSAEMIGLMLRFAGHDVQIAVDGQQAVTAAAAFAPHVILRDIGLPVMNGYEVAQRIRESPGEQPVLVALTGWGAGRGPLQVVGGRIRRAPRQACRAR